MWYTGAKAACTDELDVPYQDGGEIHFDNSSVERTPATLHVAHKVTSKDGAWAKLSSTPRYGEVRRLIVTRIASSEHKGAG